MGGLIHRELKPENIFLGQHDRVKIGDFGLARWNSRRESQMGNCQARPIRTGRHLIYSAPELRQDYPYTNHVDIFSLIFSPWSCPARNVVLKRLDENNEFW